MPIDKGQSSGIRLAYAQMWTLHIGNPNSLPVMTGTRTYDWPAAKILEGAVPKLGYTETLLTLIVVNKQVWKDSLELVNLTLLN